MSEHETPHTLQAAKAEHEWPQWLQVFDRQNNQHEKIVAELASTFTKLGQRMPDAWQGKDELNVLELAPGSGKLSEAMLRLILEHFKDKKINYFGVELDPDSVSKANAVLHSLEHEFPGRITGRVEQGDLFDGELKAKLPEGFTPDFTIMSHAMYFAPDKQKFMHEVTGLGHKDSVTMYIMNSGLSSLIPDDMVNLGDKILHGSLPSLFPQNFKSSITMPAVNPLAYLERFRTNSSAERLDKEGMDMRDLLCFLAQKDISGLVPDQRNQLLNEITDKLGKSTEPNAIPLDNQVYFVFSPNRSPSTRMAFVNSVTEGEYPIAERMAG